MQGLKEPTHHHCNFIYTRKGKKEPTQSHDTSLASAGRPGGCACQLPAHSPVPALPPVGQLAFIAAVPHHAGAAALLAYLAATLAQRRQEQQRVVSYRSPSRRPIGGPAVL
jgi:hypothetical protein